MFGSRRRQSLILVRNFKLFVVSGVYESGRKNHLRLDKTLISIVYSTRRNMANSYLVPARERNAKILNSIFCQLESESNGHPARAIAYWRSKNSTATSRSLEYSNLGEGVYTLRPRA